MNHIHLFLNNWVTVFNVVVLSYFFLGNGIYTILMLLSRHRQEEPCRAGEPFEPWLHLRPPKNRNASEQKQMRTVSRMGFIFERG